jgi:N-methylhydantoinase A/oxoprolinase/acetone carboxylase beta subunit
VTNEFAQTFVRTIDDADRSQIGDILTKLGRDARAWQREEGIEESRQRLNNEADVRYLRQGYEFSLEIDPDRLGSGGLEDSPDTLAWRTSAFMASSSINR